MAIPIGGVGIKNDSGSWEMEVGKENRGKERKRKLR